MLKSISKEYAEYPKVHKSEKCINSLRMKVRPTWKLDVYFREVRFLSTKNNRIHVVSAPILHDKIVNRARRTLHSFAGPIATDGLCRAAVSTFLQWSAYYLEVMFCRREQFAF